VGKGLGRLGVFKLQQSLLNPGLSTQPPSHTPQLLARNWRGVTLRVCTRASLACAVLHLLKAGAKRAARGRPRVEKTVGYVCDVLLPTGFYGPLAGVGWAVFAMVNELFGDYNAPAPAAAASGSQSG
jgi:hypothetical protein